MEFKAPLLRVFLRLADIASEGSELTETKGSHCNYTFQLGAQNASVSDPKNFLRRSGGLCYKWPLTNNRLWELTRAYKRNIYAD